MIGGLVTFRPEGNGLKRAAPEYENPSWSSARLGYGYHRLWLQAEVAWAETRRTWRGMGPEDRWTGCVVPSASLPK